MKMKCSIPASIASSTTCWISGRSTTVSISLGMALVAGRKRVPSPATGNTALRTRAAMRSLSLTLSAVWRGPARSASPRKARSNLFPIASGQLQRPVFEKVADGCSRHGWAGFIGSQMALELIDAGQDVLVLDNLSTGFRWAVPPEAQFVEGDIGDQNLVRQLLLPNDVDAIIHFAGSIVVPESVADPLGYYRNNICKSRSLLAVAVEAKIPHFIFSSTAAVYGMPEVNPVGEDAPLRPMSPYGSSKLMTEIMLRDT